MSGGSNFFRGRLEENILLRVRNEGSAEVHKNILRLVTGVESTQTRALFGGAVPIEVTVSLVSEMESKYSDTLLRLKG
jgi:hypothetical protein